MDTVNVISGALGVMLIEVFIVSHGVTQEVGRS